MKHQQVCEKWVLLTKVTLFCNLKLSYELVPISTIVSGSLALNNKFLTLFAKNQKYFFTKRTKMFQIKKTILVLMKISVWKKLLEDMTKRTPLPGLPKGLVPNICSSQIGLRPGVDTGGLSRSHFGCQKWLPLKPLVSTPGLWPIWEELILGTKISNQLSYKITTLSGEILV